ncbi:hypothetical protein EV356DRAFT_568133 [Viridothelium virens]|uniref:Uncharacterized protein n=1 Tax=Viridothelium virens TaxID=1048519 RepID=A0A6A6H6D0_VIRVR|nr:hypothetical protein EV356DRAFT_568133 [Viridothelium virens]
MTSRKREGGEDHGEGYISAEYSSSGGDRSKREARKTTDLSDGSRRRQIKLHAAVTFRGEQHLIPQTEVLSTKIQRLETPMCFGQEEETELIQKVVCDMGTPLKTSAPLPSTGSSADLWSFVTSDDPNSPRRSLFSSSNRVSIATSDSPSQSISSLSESDMWGFVTSDTSRRSLFSPGDATSTGNIATSTVPLSFTSSSPLSSPTLSASQTGVSTGPWLEKNRNPPLMTDDDDRCNVDQLIIPLADVELLPANARYNVSRGGSEVQNSYRRSAVNGNDGNDSDDDGDDGEARPEGSVSETEVAAVDEASRLHSLRHHDNNKLSWRRSLVVNDVSYHGNGLILVQVDWNGVIKDGTSAELLEKGDHAQTKTQRMRFHSSDRLTILSSKHTDLGCTTIGRFWSMVDVRLINAIDQLTMVKMDLDGAGEIKSPVDAWARTDLVTKVATIHCAAREAYDLLSSFTDGGVT